MLAGAGLICCCNTPSPRRLECPNFNIQSQTRNPNPRMLSFRTSFNPPGFLNPCKFEASRRKDKAVFQNCRSSLNTPGTDNPVTSVEKDVGGRSGDGGGGGGEEEKVEGRDWATSVLLFGLWAALMYYVFILSPNQTPMTDSYLLRKLLNLKGDDGFRMNAILVSLWYLLGLWPVVYSMLLLPTARSSKNSIPVWPFLVLSFAGGAYALIPYYVLWRPPPPPVEETDLSRWPLNFLESKFTAWICVAAGLGICIYAGLAGGGDWKEFYQYFRESRFVHVSLLDFTLCSAFAPFWVYNDLTARKWYDKGSWLLPLSLVPLLGPSLYVALRPPLLTMAAPASPITSKEQ